MKSVRSSAGYTGPGIGTSLIERALEAAYLDGEYSTASHLRLAVDGIKLQKTFLRLNGHYSQSIFNQVVFVLHDPSCRLYLDAQKLVDFKALEKRYGGAWS